VKQSVIRRVPRSEPAPVTPSPGDFHPCRICRTQLIASTATINFLDRPAHNLIACFFNQTLSQLTMKRYGAMRIVLSLIAPVGAFHLPATALGDDVVVGELLEGQWAEGRDEDPFGRRPIQIWLPEGTLLYKIEKGTRSTSRQWRYRDAVTYHGYPVHLQLEPSRRDYKFRRIQPNGGVPSFRLNEAVFCPGQTSPIAWPSKTCLRGDPVGEGWTFEFEGGSPEESHKDYFYVSARPDSADLAKLNLPDEALRFRMAKEDLDVYEQKGVLVRLDRHHPLHEFEFAGSYFFPCNSEKVVETKSEDIKRWGAEGSISAGLDLWGWFKSAVKGTVGYEDRNTEIAIKRTRISSQKASIFQQWGFMHEMTSEGKRSLPFFVQKEFECREGTGSTSEGDRITKVVVKFWDESQDRDDVLEFNLQRVLDEWVELDSRIFDFHDARPILLSANSSEKQAVIIQRILDERESLHYNQAVFVFAQLNNGCPAETRKKCDPLLKVK
jgi:hypothetical protein